MIQKILVLLSGIIFGLGLTLSNMTNPAKVISFLDKNDFKYMSGDIYNQGYINVL